MFLDCQSLETRLSPTASTTSKEQKDIRVESHCQEDNSTSLVLTNFSRMPSTHSATITYFGTYIPLACAYLPIHLSFPSSAISRIVPPLIVIPWAVLIAISRIWLGHHTWPQVLCGCAYGFAFAFLWFAIWAHGGNQYGGIAEAHVQSLFG